MPRSLKDHRHGPLGGLGHTIIEASFAVIGAIMLGSIGPQIFDYLLRLVAQNPQAKYSAAPISMMLPLALLGALLGWMIGRKVANAIERVGLRWDRLEQGDKVTLFMGVFAGLTMSIPVNTFFTALDSKEPGVMQAKLVVIPAVAIGLSALAIYALQSMADVLPWNRGRGPRKRTGMKILDTNVIIDGRIYEVAKAGFLQGDIYVPRFVLEELQYIADSSDALRRNRGRRGLEILGHFQDDFEVEVGTHDRHAPDPTEEVDSRIVKLAVALGADIVTNDWNLNRVANLQGVKVLSLNDLALALRTNVLPQETMPVKVIREGNQPGQGVGYLEDGTMVVIERGAEAVGETVDTVVSQVIQTERGKMIFAELAEHDTVAPRPPTEIKPAPERRKSTRRSIG